MSVHLETQPIESLQERQLAAPSLYLVPELPPRLHESAAAFQKLAPTLQLPSFNVIGLRPERGQPPAADICNIALGENKQHDPIWQILLRYRGRCALLQAVSIPGEPEQWQFAQDAGQGRWVRRAAIYDPEKKISGLVQAALARSAAHKFGEVLLAERYTRKQAYDDYQDNRQAGSHYLYDKQAKELREDFTAVHFNPGRIYPVTERAGLTREPRREVYSLDELPAWVGRAVASRVFAAEVNYSI